jgi:maltooligosyltrehalose trehalohydrolase
VSSSEWRPRLGAIPEGAGVRFRIWAPGHDRLEVVIHGPDAERLLPMEAEGDGYFTALAQGAGPGTRYRYRLDGGDSFPDPLSRSQPDGVHGASEVVDPRAFRWSDAGWRGVPLEDLVIHEIHVGTFTPEGTFDAAVGRLDYLRDLGVTAVEIMPVSDFPGEQNWGYDGVFLFAPAASYGGSEGLKRFVDEAHRRGLAVLLDAVYNHFGPEGNYFPVLTSGRIFNEAHHTPWGAAVNYDGPGSAAVRELVIENALHWAHEYHLDGLRLDATHAIIDDSPTHVLRELVERVRAGVGAGRHFLLIAEDERNERGVVLPASQGGLGLDGVWADDFHHQLRRLVAGDREGYYANYRGTAADLAETLRRGWFYEGQHYPTHDEPRGTEAGDLPPARFVHAIQNHDQIGNRAHGGRLNHEVPLPAYRAASALLLLSPYTPLLFMGQEWAASTPFLYFTDHPEDLGQLVTAGRREEFKHFSAFADAAERERIPDPQASGTFQRSKLRWEETGRQPHAGVLALYRELLRLRATHPALKRRDRDSFAVEPLGDGGLLLRREGTGGESLLLVAAFRGPLRASAGESALLQPPPAGWRARLWTEEPRFGGDAPPAESAEHRITLPSAGALLLAPG